MGGSGPLDHIAAVEALHLTHPLLQAGSQLRWRRAVEGGIVEIAGDEAGRDAEPAAQAQGPKRALFKHLVVALALCQGPRLELPKFLDQGKCSDEGQARITGLFIANLDLIPCAAGRTGPAGPGP